MGQFVGTDYGDDIIFKQIRHVKNDAYNQYNPSSTTIPDSPIPKFENKTGYWNTETTNSKYDSGYIDFSEQGCTGGYKKWRFKYLLDESEFPANKSFGSGTSGDKPYMPSNGWDNSWRTDSTTKNSPDSHGSGFDVLFNDFDSPAVGYARRKANLSRNFVWGYIDNPDWTDGQSFVKCWRANNNNKAHYTRTKGITFRYKQCCVETGGLDMNLVGQELEDYHGSVPLFQFGLLFVKSDETSDDYIYYAELIAASKELSKTQDGDKLGGRCYNSYKFHPNGRQASGSVNRHIIGKASHRFDYEVTAKSQVPNPNWQVGDDEDGQFITVSEKKSGNGPWDEHGNFSHQTDYFKSYNGYEVLGGPPEQPASGVCTLILSNAAAKKVWQEDMVCVGFLCQSTHTSRQSGFMGSRSDFMMYPPKLLEQEYEGDTKLVLEQPDFVPGEPMYTSMMRPKTTPVGAHDYLKNTRLKTPNYKAPIDLII